MTSDATIAPTPENEADILCPLCDYNLRGLTEPRCPECGHRSTWEELRNRPPLHPYLFEHHPNRNVWSFVRTVVGSVRPIKFWQSVKPAMKLFTGRLIVFALLCLLIAVVASGFGIFGSAVQMAQANAARKQALMQTISGRINPNSSSYDPALAARVNIWIKQYGSLQATLEHSFPPITSPLFWANAFRQGMFSRQQQGTADRAAALVLCWVPLTFLSLLIFQISMRRARIRTGHVLRCVVYTAAPICFYGIYLIAVSVCISVFVVPGYMDFTFFASMGLLLFLAIRLAVAYRLYLRFHQAIATVLASQIIVALALLKINLMLLGH